MAPRAIGELEAATLVVRIVILVDLRGRWLDCEEIGIEVAVLAIFAVLVLEDLMASQVMVV